MEVSYSSLVPSFSLSVSSYTLSFIHFVFLSSVMLSPALSPTVVKQMLLVTPPSGDTNTSFPVAWHQGSHESVIGITDADTQNGPQQNILCFVFFQKGGNIL